MTDKVELGLKKIESLETEFIELAQSMYQNTYFYTLDLLANAVFDRTLKNNHGFCLLIRNNNFNCAAPIVRMQLDNLLRFHATYLVEDPQVFAREVLSGQHVRRLKDINGRKMFDSHLVDTLSERLPWIKSVYDNTSGFVHLSEKHIYSTLKLKEEGKRTVQSTIGKQDNESVSDEDRLEAIQCMITINEEIYRVLNGWVKHKEKNLQKHDLPTPAIK